MRRAAWGGTALLISAVIFVTPGVPPAGVQALDGTRSIPAAGTTSIRSLPFGSEGLQQPELRARRQDQEGPAANLAARGDAVEFNRARPEFKDRDPFPKQPLDAPRVRTSVVEGSDAVLSIDGLNHRDQRLANNGNQFSVEPPRRHQATDV